jgi:heme-binding NEAT domain protein
VTGAPVAVGEKDREFIPVGVTTSVTKGDSAEVKNASMTSTSSTAPADATGTVSVKTNPEGADVYVDSQFYGNSPATLKLKSGKHTIGVKMSGYKDWSRELATDVGSDAHLTATLEKN